MYWKTPLGVVFLSLTQSGMQFPNEEVTRAMKTGDVETEESVFTLKANALVVIAHFRKCN